VLAAIKLDGFGISWAGVFACFWMVMAVFLVAWLIFCVGNIRGILRRTRLLTMCLHFLFITCISLFVGSIIVPEFVLLLNLTRRLHGDDSVTISVIFLPILICWGMLAAGVFVCILMLPFVLRSFWNPASTFEPMTEEEVQSSIHLQDLPEPMDFLRLSSNFFRRMSHDIPPEQHSVSIEDGIIPATGYGIGYSPTITSPRQSHSEECIVCAETPPNTIFLPCGHSVCCLDCAEKWVATKKAKCMLCRAKIETFVRIEAEERNGMVKVTQEYKII
jgi:hypothetical protein